MGSELYVACILFLIDVIEIATMSKIFIPVPFLYFHQY